MKLTNKKLKEMIWNAENNNACKSSLYQIRSCKTIKELLQHENAIKWAIWYTERLLKGEWDLLEFVFKSRTQLNCINESDMRRLLQYVFLSRMC